MKIRKFRAGDMVESASDSEEDKAKTAGLAASNAEKKSSGFLGLGRLFQGNIDEKGSEAYNQYGAGYGRKIEAENDRLKAATLRDTAAPAAPAAPAASAPAPVRIHKTAETKPAAAAEAKYRGSSDYSDTADMKRNQSNVAGPSTTPEKGDKGARDTSSFKKPAAPAAKTTSPTQRSGREEDKAVPKAPTAKTTSPTQRDGREEDKAAPKSGSASGSGGGRGPTYAQVDAEKQRGFAANPMSKDPAQRAAAKASAPAAKAPESAKPAEKQLSQAQQRAQAAVARATGNSSGVASGRVTAAEAGRNIASVAGKAGDAVSSVGNFFKNFETPAERRSRLAKEAKSSQKAGGGAIRGYASGGSVSSRADGIAQRGKTRGKMC
jgi:hypothetical protein